MADRIDLSPYLKKLKDWLSSISNTDEEPMEQETAMSPLQAEPGQEQSGAIEMVGKGKASVRLSFDPTEYSCRIDDSPHIPPSCGPVPSDIIKIFVKKELDHWSLGIEWDVIGVKSIIWKASR